MQRVSLRKSPVGSYSLRVYILNVILFLAVARGGLVVPTLAAGKIARHIANHVNHASYPIHALHSTRSGRHNICDRILTVLSTHHVTVSCLTVPHYSPTATGLHSPPRPCIPCHCRCVLVAVLTRTHASPYSSRRYLYPPDPHHHHQCQLQVRRPRFRGSFPRMDCASTQCVCCRPAQ